ncbi:hypothetical protein ACFL9T_22645 [Thermodesulfobacteriota bacterium]
MRCAICGIEVETIDQAIENDWLPSFYEGEVEHGPVCSACAETMIGVGDEGEMELKAEYRGKVQYVDEDYTHQSKEDLMIEIFMTDERKGLSH